MSIVRYETNGLAVLACVPGLPPEVVGMFLTDALATLAAAGMNSLNREGRLPRHHEQLQPRRDFTPAQDWPTQYLPQIPS